MQREREGREERMDMRGSENKAALHKYIYIFSQRILACVGGYNVDQQLRW